MNRRKRLLLSVAIAAMVVCVPLAVTGVYSAGQLRGLKVQAVYANPEDGMRAPHIVRNAKLLGLINKYFIIIAALVNQEPVYS